MSEFSYKLGVMVKQAGGLGDLLHSVGRGAGSVVGGIAPGAGAALNAADQVAEPHLPSFMQATPPPAPPPPTLMDKAKAMGSQGIDKAKELGGQGMDWVKNHPGTSAGIGAGAIGAGALGYYLMQQKKKQQAQGMQ